MTKLETIMHDEIEKYGQWPNPGSVKRYVRLLDKVTKALKECIDENESSCGREKSIFQGMHDTIEMIQNTHWERMEYVHMPCIRAAAEVKKYERDANRRSAAADKLTETVEKIKKFRKGKRKKVVVEKIEVIPLTTTKDKRAAAKLADMIRKIK